MSKRQVYKLKISLEQRQRQAAQKFGISQSMASHGWKNQKEKWRSLTERNIKQKVAIWNVYFKKSNYFMGFKWWFLLNLNQSRNSNQNCGYVCMT